MRRRSPTREIARSTDAYYCRARTGHAPLKGPPVQLRTALLTTSFALLALAATACTGSDSADPTATATATTEATATSEPTATPAPSATETAEPSGTASPTRTAPRPTATATATAPPAGVPVSILFSRHPASDNDPSLVFPVERVSPNSGVARYAVEQLLAGPTAPEKANGFFSVWTDFTYGGGSDCGGDPFELTLESGTLTVRFCTTVVLIGSVADGQAETSMKETLLLFSTVDRVVLLDQFNDCLFNASGMNLCLEP